jgi:hypothetical protein
MEALVVHLITVGLVVFGLWVLFWKGVCGK